MAEYRKYSYTGYFRIDREDVIEDLNEGRDEKLPDDYEPTSDE